MLLFLASIEVIRPFDVAWKLKPVLKFNWKRKFQLYGDFLRKEVVFFLSSGNLQFNLKIIPCNQIAISKKTTKTSQPLVDQLLVRVTPCLHAAAYAQFLLKVKQSCSHVNFLLERKDKLESFPILVEQQLLKNWK